MPTADIAEARVRAALTLLRSTEDGPAPRSTRWIAVRCSWRLRSGLGEAVIVREWSGHLSDAFTAELLRRGADACMGEVMVECLASGRIRFASLDALAGWRRGVPPPDADSVWHREHTHARRRSKLLRDIDGACSRGLRRGILDARGVRLARAVLETLSSPGMPPGQSSSA